jgi:hypothetical protein
MSAAQYPRRFVRPDSELVKEQHDVGLTNKVYTRYWVDRIVECGVYVRSIGDLAPQLVEWDKLPNWRILIIRRARSRRAGRTHQMVEHWYLHRAATPEHIDSLANPRIVRVQTPNMVLTLTVENGTIVKVRPTEDQLSQPLNGQTLAAVLAAHTSWQEVKND